MSQNIEQLSSNREREVFLHALEKNSAAERAAFWDAACRGDAQLRIAVEALLANANGSLVEQVAAEARPTQIVAITEQAGDRIGRYKLLQRIGEGGMGVVYMAEQEEPVRRQVALKIIKLGMDTRSVVARFEAERQALALMDHPNIAKVLDAGATETGRPYFVMELVRGVPITTYCDKNHLGTAVRLDLFIQVCHAIQHARQKGIIHRDIKPSNVMVTVHDGVPVPKVIDFGVAKATGQRLTEKTLFTNYATMIGTPAYMSPEQAEMSGLDIDTRTDVYALGVLLYELLTGTTPFPSAELLSKGYGEMQRIIAEVEPARPSTRLSTMQNEQRTVVAKNRGTDESALGRGLKGDLDWIVMKCLEKDRARRYETANGLAADLKRHLGNEPVVARPPSVAYRFQKLVRRNKLAFAAAGAVMAAVLIGLAVALVGLRQESKARQQAEASRREMRRNNYSAEMSLGFQAVAENNFVRAKKLFERQRPHAGEEDLRGFEWRLLGRLSQESSLHIFSAPNPTGRPDKSADTTVAFSPVEPRLAIGRDNGTVRFWNPVTHQPLGEPFKAHGREIRCLAFSPDGKILATASGGIFTYTPCSLRLWDVASQQLLVERKEAHALGIESLHFSPDGKLLASASTDRNVKLWFLPDCELRATLEGHRDNVTSALFAPDGTTLATASQDGTVKLWAMPDGRELGTISSNRAAVAAISFSRDGRTLAVASGDKTVVLWDVATKLRTSWLPQRSVPCSVAFSPDGKFLACGQQGAVALWDLATETEADTLGGHLYPVFSLAFSPDGQQLATTCAGGGARLWHGTPHPKVPTFHAHADGVTSVAYARNGRILATGSGQFWQPRRPNEIKLWDAATGRLLKTLPGHEGDVMWLIFTPDDQTLISASRDATARLWDVTSGRELARFEVSDRHGVWHTALSPDGKTLAVSHGRDHMVRLWDITTQQELPPLPAAGTVDRVVFTPDGRHLVSADGGGWMLVWDTASWQQVRSWKDKGFFTAMDLSPDGKLLATVRLTENIKLRSPDSVESGLLSLREAGISLALGSDGPLNPGLNLMFAVLHPIRPSEALSREQAVEAYTRGSAYAEFAERDKGTIEEGKLADLAVLSQDIFTVPPNALPATKSVLTLVGGRIVHNDGINR